MILSKLSNSEMLLQQIAFFAFLLFTAFRRVEHSGHCNESTAGNAFEFMSHSESKHRHDAVHCLVLPSDSLATCSGIGRKLCKKTYPTAFSIVLINPMISNSILFLIHAYALVRLGRKENWDGMSYPRSTHTYRQ
jgi:hypothetical protein